MGRGDLRDQPARQRRRVVIATGVIAAGPGVIRPLHTLGSVARTFCALVGGPEMVELRPQRCVLLQPMHMHHSWQLAPRLSLHASMSILPPPFHATRAATEGAPRRGPLADAPPPAALPMRERIETVLTRHTRSLVETLTAPRRRVPSMDTASMIRVPPSAMDGRASVLAQPSASSPPMIVSRPARPTEVAAETRTDPAPDVRRSQPFPSAPQSSPRAPDLQVERIADRVIRALDHRMVAWRERMGRS